jgi:hypothetical protein
MERLNVNVQPAPNAPRVQIPMDQNIFLEILTENLRRDAVGKWGPCKLKWGSLKSKKMREKLMGGVIYHAFEVVRIPNDPLLKNKIHAYILLHHGTGMTDAEYNKYVPKFKLLDQVGLDAWMDEDQRRLNVE